MQSKNNKTPAQAREAPETPAQKEIRLLRKRLKKAKKEWDWYREHWEQELSAHAKTKEELMYAGKIIKLQNLTIQAASCQTLSNTKYEKLSAGKNTHCIEKLNKIIYLICTNAGPIEKTLPDGTTTTYWGYGLEHLERYTASAIVTNEEGFSCYLLSELNDSEKLCERFVLSTKAAHLKVREQKR